MLGEEQEQLTVTVSELRLAGTAIVHLRKSVRAAIFTPRGRACAATSA